MAKDKIVVPDYVAQAVEENPRARVKRLYDVVGQKHCPNCYGRLSELENSEHKVVPWCFTCQKTYPNL